MCWLVTANMLTRQYLILLLTPLIAYVHSAKILGVFNFPSISHQLVFQPIWKELSLRGHEVTVLTPNPLKDPSLTNLTEIDLSFQYKTFEKLMMRLSTKGTNHWSMMSNFATGITENVRELLFSDTILNFINDNTSSYDVVLVEAVDPAAYAFAAKFGCPVIGISSLSVSNPTHEAYGNPTHPTLHPDMVTPYHGGDLGFFEKVDAVLFDLYERYVYNYRLIPTINSIVKETFGKHYPDVRDVQKEMSLLFLNTNPIIHGTRPYGPNVIEIGGGMNIKPKKPLPPVKS